MSENGICPDCGGELELHGRTMRWCENCRMIIGVWTPAETRKEGSGDE